MDQKKTLQIDPRPNRRKDKDNPYTIFTVGCDARSRKSIVRQ